MLLYSVLYKCTVCLFGILSENKKSESKKSKRKVKISPPYLHIYSRNVGAFLFAPLRAALTIEAAVVLPMFLLAMIAALQYGNAMETAVKFGTSLTETGKMMAAAAYAERFGGDLDEAPEIAVKALSTVYTKQRLLSQAKNTSSVKKVNLLLSTFLQEDDTIDLVLTYQIRSPVGIINLPGSFFLQRARVRAWTGRDTGGEGDADGGEGDGTFVYVTETGSVYHDDPNCTHLKLSIREVDASELDSLRNNSGGKYHKCEKCGGEAAGEVYITSEGDRYHSSLSCSGLKRTVRQVSKEELGDMKACSRCGKK